MSEKSKRTPGAPRAREDADAGVRDCLDLMTSGMWVTGRSHRDIADKHGVHPDTVKKWATNASRIIRLAIEGDVEDIRARMLSTLEGITADARVTGDHRAAVAAVAEQGKLLGLVVQKHEVNLTPDEAEKLIAEAAALGVKP